MYANTSLYQLCIREILSGRTIITDYTALYPHINIGPNVILSELKNELMRFKPVIITISDLKYE